MTDFRFVVRSLMLPTVVFVVQAVSALAASPQPDDATGESGLAALTRGVVHEGFAQPLAFDPTAGPIVALQPPVDGGGSRVSD